VESRAVCPAPATAAEAMVAAGAAFHELVSARMLADRAITLDLRHPVYDCFYLALAEARGSRSVTADDGLLRVCARTPVRQAGTVIVIRALAGSPVVMRQR